MAVTYLNLQFYIPISSILFSNVKRSIPQSIGPFPPVSIRLSKFNFPYRPTGGGSLSLCIRTERKFRLVSFYDKQKEFRGQSWRIPSLIKKRGGEGLESKERFTKNNAVHSLKMQI